MKVLIVDDESHIRALVKAVLASIQAEVVGEAGNGKDAVTLYSDKQPEMVLMDINMPVMDGKEALKAIVELDPNAFVIMLTSLSDMQSVQTCLEYGASGYLRKDLPVAELRKAIQDAWQENQAS